MYVFKNGKIKHCLLTFINKLLFSSYGVFNYFTDIITLLLVLVLVSDGLLF